MSAVLTRERRWEPTETRLLQACLRPGCVAVDVGANLGYFSVLFALSPAPVERVFAFEPAADNFSLLEENLRLNRCAGRVTAVAAALGERDGPAVLRRSADNLGDHRVDADGGGGDREPIRLLHGDTYLGARTERVNVLKIDTQGTEMAVCRGLSRLLHASRRELQLLVELTPFALRRAGSSGRELVSFLAELDLPLAIVDHVGDRVVPETAEALCRWCDNVDATAGDEGFMNIFVGEIPRSIAAD